MKKIKPLFLYFLFILLCIFSCRQELNSFENEVPNNNRVFMTHKNSSDFSKNFSLVNKLQNVQKSLKKWSKNAGKNSDSLYNVDFEQALYLEDVINNRHSYIFKIKNQNPSSFDIHNLVLAFQNGAYQAYIATYTLTEEERNLITSGQNVNLKNKTFLQPLDIENVNINGKNGSCYELVVYTEDCSCHSTHASGGCTHPTTVYDFIWRACTTGGSGGTGAGNNGGPSNGGMTGGGGGSSSGNGNSSGNTGILLTPDGEPIDDPCIKASASVVASTSMLKNNQVQNNVDAVLKTKIQAPNEFGLKIGKYTYQSTVGYSFSSLKEGTPTNADLTNLTISNGVYVADAHSHAGGRGHPSAGDLYDMLAKLTTATQYTTKFIYGNDAGTPEVYALTFTDKNLASAFLSQYPRNQNYNEQSHSFNLNTTLGAEYNDALTFANQGTFENTNNEGEHYSSGALALTYILDKFNSGISLSKADENGNLKKIIVTMETITPVASTPRMGLKVGKCP